MAAINKVMDHDPDAKLYYAVNFAGWLTPGTTLASCTVDVVDGTAKVDPSVGGVGATSASATITGTFAIIALVSATAGSVKLKWTPVASNGETTNKTTRLNVANQ